MFKYRCKRCVASLLLVVIVSGLFSPLTAYATQSSYAAAADSDQRTKNGLTYKEFEDKMKAGGASDTQIFDAWKALPWDGEVPPTSNPENETSTGGSTGKRPVTGGTSSGTANLGSQTKLGMNYAQFMAKRQLEGKTRGEAQTEWDSLPYDQPNSTTGGSSSTTTPTYNEDDSGSSDDAQSSTSSDRGGCLADTSNIPDTRQAANYMYAVDYMINHWADDDDTEYSDTTNDEDVALAYRINGEILLSEQSKKTDIYEKYNGWISDQQDFTTDDFNEWFNRVADIAGAEERVDIGFMSQSDPLQVIHDHLSNYVTGDVTHMSDGTLGHYILMSFMVLTNPELFNTEESIQTFAQYAGAALNRPQGEDRPMWDVLSNNYGMNNDSSDYCVDEGEHVYNPSNLGILYFGSGGDENNPSATEGADVLAKYALSNCVLQYHQIITKIQIAAQSNTLNSPEAQNLLRLAKLYDEVFSGILPYINRMFNYDIYQGNTAKDLCNMHNVSTDVDDFVNSLTDRSFTSSITNDTPFDLFYTLNSDIPVVAVDRETVLNDVEVNTSYDDALIEKLEEQHHYSSMEDDPYLYFEENQLTVGNMGTMQGDVSNLATNMMAVAPTASEPVDGSGVASLSSAVTINKWIQEGMAYSATYVPMRTNIYDASTQKVWSDEFKEEFYYKYGYNRKALLIDTSGTSAVDFYNSNGLTQGTRRIATLRDILECGENDVTLFIDGNFYNADQAISAGNALRTTRNNVLNNLADDLTVVMEAMQVLPWKGENWLSRFGNWVNSLFISVESDGENLSLDEFYDKAKESMLKRYKFNLDYGKTQVTKVEELAQEVAQGYLLSYEIMIDDVMLKTNGYSKYSDNIMNILNEVEDPSYRSVKLDNDPDDVLTEDNKDTVVMPSSFIKQYMDSWATYASKVRGENDTITKTTYKTYATYTPLSGLAFVSLLYRSPNYYALNNAVEGQSPVFMASDDLCALVSDSGSNQWYRNSLLNWMLIKNLRANVQIDYTYCIDLDCPIYMDIFGNILTESGIVVVPAASNATLHTAAFKEYNIATALYSVYGKLYHVPTSLPGAYSVLYPYFVADNNAGYYIISPLTIGINGRSINLDRVNLYDDETKEAVRGIYVNNIRSSNTTTRLNFIAMVEIINEVLRGAPIANIDKAKENLIGDGNKSQSATVAAIKYESLLDSLRGSIQNTLIAIPDFASMDGAEYYIALMIKFMIVLTTAVVIIFVYRDGVSGQFGLRTLWRSLSAIALTFICIVVTPAVFQLTYYTANKVMLEDECFHILLLNEEKRQTGMEVGMTQATSTNKDDKEFMLQLDWLSVPWWKEIEHVLYGNTVSHVNQVKLEAYLESPIFQNSDVTLQNDGVFMSTSDLFDSVVMDYTWKPNSNGATGLYLWDTGTEQSASFYSPYYVFLESLTANVNEYNQGRPGQLANENFTAKVMAGSKLKTVGLSYNYFNSTDFMEDDLDILRLFQVYMDEDAEVPPGLEEVEMDIKYLLDLYGTEIEIDPDTGEAIDAPEVPEVDGHEAALLFTQPQYTIGQIQRQLAQAESYAFDRTLLYNDEDREAFRHCLWYNTDAVHDFANRVKALDQCVRDFVADNHDMMTKVTDETFIKVLALYASVKYNQLFGIPSANALEIYNLSSEDLLRLCLLDDTEAALSVSMSFPRLVYNYGGEASIYLSAILSVILWVGSFIKPLCTVIVFISVFLSIWVFRVLLRKPSANLFGYLITITLLCLTNLLHAVLLKVSVWLPNTGLSLLGCLIFMVVIQVAYLLVLGYVTGVALKDWSNLGYAEYEKEVMRAKAKFSNEEVKDGLSGRIKHHDDNWEYYNDLVRQHRSRNT